jgi:renal tumor antigen
MVNKDTFTLKLVDFGSTRGLLVNAPYTEYVSTRWYRAPECILTSGSYGPEVDEWAIGCMLYELLTTRPLFPGKHEIDQIGRIHNVLGTPSRDILAQFKRNPNTQISFTFPQRVPQDMRKILPKTSQPTIDLLAALLTYNPQQRISAADALNMDCFGEIRQAELEWEQTESTVPFPVFFLQRTPAPKPANPRPRVEPPKPVFHPPEVLPVHNESAYVPPAPEMVMPKPIPVQASVKVLPALGHGKPVVNPADPALIESRIRAAQRIKAYEEAVKARKAKKPMPFHGAAFQFAAAKGMYQKPRPDLVEPRLPKLMF